MCNSLFENSGRNQAIQIQWFASELEIEQDRDGVSENLTNQAMLRMPEIAHLACRAGCSVCCQHHLSVFPVEAAMLRAAVQSLPPDVQTRLRQQAAAVREREACGLSVACPMLIDDQCAVYEARPLICRTQGLPLLIETEDGAQEVDFCPLNFTTPDAVAELDEEHLVPLTFFNFQLAVANLLYCRASGISDAESGSRIAMSECILKA